MFYIFKAKTTSDITLPIIIKEANERELELCPYHPYGGYVTKTDKAVYIENSRCIEFSFKTTYIANVPRSIWMPVYPNLRDVAQQYAYQIASLTPTVSITIEHRPYTLITLEDTTLQADMWVHVYSQVPVTKQRDYIMSTAIVLARTMSVALASYVCREKHVPESFWDYLGYIYEYVPRADVLPGKFMFHPRYMVGNPEIIPLMGHAFARAFKHVHAVTSFKSWKGTRYINTRVPEGKIYEYAYRLHSGEMMKYDTYSITL